MNLLVPAVGAKVYLVRRLRQAVHRRGGRLFGCDTNPAAAALREVDEVVVLPGFDDQAFWPALSGVLGEHRIDAVLPVRDAELATWAAYAESGQLTAATLISRADTLATCADKRRLYRHAAQLGLHCPRWVSADDHLGMPSLGLPVIVKPCSGSGSRGVRRVDSAGDLVRVAGDARMLVQQLRQGTEFSVDCYADAQGGLRAHCVRERTAVRDGQSIAGIVIEDATLAAHCCALARGLEFRGVVNLQFIRDHQADWLIDVNPRLPGGIAITEEAGYAFIEWTVDELAGAALHTSVRSPCS